MTITELDKEILKYVALGYENKEIAKIMHISVHTVKAHISKICKELHAVNRSNAVYIGVKSKIIK